MLFVSVVLRQKAVIYHNYASGPISSDPHTVLLKCAVILSAFIAETEGMLLTLFLYMSRLLACLSVYDAIQRFF